MPVDCPLGVACTGLEDVHGALDGGWCVELPHHAQCVGQQLLVVLGLDQDTASLEIDDMEVVTIHQHSVSGAAKGLVQRLEACIHVDLNHALARACDQRVDECGVLLRHRNVFGVKVRVVEFLASEQLLGQFMDVGANGCGLARWLGRHLRLKPDRAGACHESFSA
jgi:hypothetical protein